MPKKKEKKEKGGRKYKYGANNTTYTKARMKGSKK